MIVIGGGSSKDTGKGIADTLNLKVIELVVRSLRQTVNNDPKGREDMAFGQYVTGMTDECAGGNLKSFSFEEVSGVCKAAF